MNGHPYGSPTHTVWPAGVVCRAAVRHKTPVFGKSTRGGGIKSRAHAHGCGTVNVHAPSAQEKNRQAPEPPPPAAPGSAREDAPVTPAGASLVSSAVAGDDAAALRGLCVHARGAPPVGPRRQCALPRGHRTPALQGGAGAMGPAAIVTMS